MTLRPMRTAAILAVLAFALPAAAQAERLAVLLGNHDYTSQPDLPGAVPFDRIAARLDRAGFATVVLDGLSPAQAADRLDRLRPRMRDADRLIIVVGGHILRSSRETWLLGPRAGSVTALSVGLAAVPIGPLVDIAADSPGRAILALADDAGETGRGAGLEPFALPETVPQGVTMLAGPSAALAAA